MAAVPIAIPGLQYVTDAEAGIRRVRAGKGFTYVNADGRKVTDVDVLSRIRSLAVPPAWTDVWICPRERGHLQATGRDARGRKQYRYHDAWRATRDETKFHRMPDFAKALPLVRKRVRADVAREGLPPSKVLAAVVNIMDRTFIRVGNDEYAKENGSYGLTTLRNKHAAVRGAMVTLSFVGKSGKRHEVTVEDARLARIVRRCRDLPGHQLFGYIGDDGELRGVGSADVNDYVREASGGDFTAKDFRTWGGTVLFARALAELGPARSKAQATRNINEALRAVSAILGNTPAVCKRAYVHPMLIESYVDGIFQTAWDRAGKARVTGLRRDEARVASMLRALQRAKKTTSRAAA
jgi:DNA topoisomerase I